MQTRCWINCGGRGILAALTVGWKVFVLIWCVSLCTPGGYLVSGHHSHRAGERRAASLGAPPHEGFIPHPKEQPAHAGGQLQQTAQGVHRGLPQQRAQFCMFFFFSIWGWTFQQLVGVFLMLVSSIPQRPTAKELLKHKLIVRHAKKTSYLTELVDKYKRWKAEQSRTTESSSDESDS